MGKTVWAIVAEGANDTDKICRIMASEKACWDFLQDTFPGAIEGKHKAEVFTRKDGTKGLWIGDYVEKNPEVQKYYDGKEQAFKEAREQAKAFVIRKYPMLYQMCRDKQVEINMKYFINIELVVPKEKLEKEKREWLTANAEKLEGEIDTKAHELNKEKLNPDKFWDRVFTRYYSGCGGVGGMVVKEIPLDEKFTLWDLD